MILHPHVFLQGGELDTVVSSEAVHSELVDLFLFKSNHFCWVKIFVDLPEFEAEIEDFLEQGIEYTARFRFRVVASQGVIISVVS